MKTFVVYFSIVILFFSAVSCSDSSIGVQLTEEIRIERGATVHFPDENLKVQFAKVIADSRFPLNALCIWGGMAEVEFVVTLNGEESKTVVAGMLNDDGSSSDSLAGFAFGYRIKLMKLEPYPDLSDTIAPQNHNVVIVVERTSLSGEEQSCDPVYFTHLPPDYLQMDQFEMSAVDVTDDTLTVSVGYSGGCKDHDFKLYMSPASFMESNPVQVNLYVVHDSDDDMCEAYITEDRSFCVDRIADLCNQIYGTCDEILLNVYGYYEDTPTGKITVTYTP